MACPKCKSSAVQAVWNNIVGNHKTCTVCLYRFFCDDESIETIADIHQDIRDFRQLLHQLKTDFDTMQKEMKELSNKVNEIYYAPGMPGCYDALARFESHT